MRWSLVRQLQEKYPTLFSDLDGDKRHTCMAYGIACEDGWYRLIDNVSAEIMACDPNAVYQQIKEKYGRLRVYLIGNKQAQDVADGAEDRSSEICERCGATVGVSMNVTNGSYRTLCQTCVPSRRQPREGREDAARELTSDD